MQASYMQTLQYNGPLKDDAKGSSGFRHPGVVLLAFYFWHNTVMRVCCLLQSIAGGDVWI